MSSARILLAEHRQRLARELSLARRWRPSPQAAAARERLVREYAEVTDLEHRLTPEPHR